MWRGEGCAYREQHEERKVRAGAGWGTKAGWRTVGARGLFSRKLPEVVPTQLTLRHLLVCLRAPGPQSSALVHLEVCRSGPALPAAQGIHGNRAAEGAGAPLNPATEAEALLTEDAAGTAIRTAVAFPASTLCLPRS